MNRWFQICAQLGSCNVFFSHHRPPKLKYWFFRGSFARLTSQSQAGNLSTYDAVSVWVQDLVPKSDESESGQMVPEKVNWAWYDVYLSQTMWNQTKKSLKQLKRSNSLISHWFPVEMVHNGPKLIKRKRFFLRLNFFLMYPRYAIRKLTSRAFWKCGDFFLL